MMVLLFAFLIANSFILDMPTVVIHSFIAFYKIVLRFISFIRIPRLMNYYNKILYLL